MTGPHVSRGQRADLERKRVTTRGARVRRPRQTPARSRGAGRRPKYQTAGALGAFSSMLVAVFAATGSIFAAVGAVTSAGAGVTCAYLEYRRDLIEVKRTGRPIGAPDPQQQPATPPPAPAAQPVAAAKTPAKSKTPKQHGPEGHVCQAKTPAACPYNRAARGGARKTAARKRTTKTTTRKP